MTIDDKTIDNLAQLARLEFDANQKNRIKEDLTRILEFCDKLSEIDTQGIEPLIYMHDEVNVLREDSVTEHLSKADALRNAPLRDSDYFKVPKVKK